MIPILHVDDPEVTCSEEISRVNIELIGFEEELLQASHASLDLKDQIVALKKGNERLWNAVNALSARMDQAAVVISEMKAER
jgi:hypothetical protein